MKKNQKKIKKMKFGLPVMPWNVVDDGMAKYGNWKLMEVKSNSRSYQRGNEKIVVVKLAPEKWKAQYFSRGRLLDMSGAWDVESLKRILIEMAIFKSDYFYG